MSDEIVAHQLLAFRQPTDLEVFCHQRKDNEELRDDAVDAKYLKVVMRSPSPRLMQSRLTRHKKELSRSKPTAMCKVHIAVGLLLPHPVFNPIWQPVLFTGLSCRE